MTQLLFVYGTLRRTCNSKAHQTYLADAEFVADAKLQAKLFRISYYPAIVLTCEDSWVQGEVYKLSSEAQLDALDVYEECTVPPMDGQEYIRIAADAVLATGELIRAWTYVYNRPTETLELIASGDFLQP
jgi:gamma-glutamylcyclotransferase (GGCT)/AIG2-like uncharacterized protein YtfP